MRRRSSTHLSTTVSLFRAQCSVIDWACGKCNTLITVAGGLEGAIAANSPESVREVPIHTEVAP